MKNRKKRKNREKMDFDSNRQCERINTKKTLWTNMFICLQNGQLAGDLTNIKH